MRITEEFVFFWRTPECFSNWHPSTFELYDQKFKNAEQALMAYKAIAFNDEETLAEILATSDPHSIKQLGRQVRNYNDETWATIRYDTMVEICYAKFTQNQKMKDFLLATGNRVIVEASPYDKIWGVGLEETNDDILDPANWQGHNLLGEALMKVRQRIIEEILGRYLTK